MLISLIAAVSKNGAIGSNNDLPWYLPADLKYFKQTTLGHPIIVGRVTFESFGGKPLPKRRNLIITRNENYKAEDAEVYTSLDDALKTCENEDEVFICGGSQIYYIALPLCDRLYITEVDTVISADRYFPSFDIDDWNLISQKYKLNDDENKYAMTWKVFERKR